MDKRLSPGLSREMNAYLRIAFSSAPCVVPLAADDRYSERWPRPLHHESRRHRAAVFRLHGAWVVVASQPFEPEILLPAINHYIRSVRLTEFDPYGFKSSFNATHPGKAGNPNGCWASPWRYGQESHLSAMH